MTSRLASKIAKNHVRGIGFPRVCKGSLSTEARQQWRLSGLAGGRAGDAGFANTPLWISHTAEVRLLHYLTLKTLHHLACSQSCHCVPITKRYHTFPDLIRTDLSNRAARMGTRSPSMHSLCSAMRTFPQVHRRWRGTLLTVKTQCFHFQSLLLAQRAKGCGHGVGLFVWLSYPHTNTQMHGAC